MGIKGLTSFLEEVQATVFRTAKLSNKCFVIDGCSLAWFLYLQGNTDIRCGGDYAEYKKVIVEFFDNLKACSIFPIIVFDGAFDINKRETQIRRLQNYACQVPLIMSKSTDFPILPLLAAQAFQQTLEELQIAFAYSLHDADRDVAAIANVLDAYAVSNDSDFFILPLKEGYISLSFLEWNKVLCERGQPYIRGQVYKSTHLASRNQVSPSLLFYLPAFLGCDWTTGISLSQFVALQKQLRNGKGKRVRAVLKWLNQYRSSDDVLNALKCNVKSERIEEIKWCLDYYQNLPDITECQSVLKEQLKKSTVHFPPLLKDIHERCIDKLASKSVQDPVELSTRFGKYPSSSFSVCKGNRTVLLPVVVGNSIYQRSPHHWSYSIRNATYRLLSTNAISEYCQQGRAYQQLKTFYETETCSCLNMTRDFMSLSRMAEQGEESDPSVPRMHFMETLLGCLIVNSSMHKQFASSFPKGSDNEVIAAATLFWIVHAEPPSFIVSAVLLVLSDPNSDFSNQILSLFTKQNRSISVTTTYISHLSEWQSCVRHAMVLNKTLLSPLCDPPINFDCTLIVDLCQALSDGSEQLRKSSLLPAQVLTMYKRYEFMLQYCSPDRDGLWVESRTTRKPNHLHNSRGRRRRR